MMSPELAHALLLLIVAVIIALMLMRPWGVAEVFWVGGGASLLILLGLVPLPLAGKAVAEGTDVYLFLIGMMLLSELAREHGVFDWLSSIAVRSAHGSSARLFLLVYALGTVVTIFMSNDATAVVLTPAILTATRKAKVEALPYLFVCALIANAASFVLPISNPANLVVFRDHMPSLGAWMASFAAPSLLSIVVTYAVIRWLFRSDLRGGVDSEVDVVPLNERGKLVLSGLAFVVVILLICSAKGIDLGLPTCVAALLATAVVSLRAKANPWPLLKEISWSTLVLVAGLFVLVDGVESIGALKMTEQALSWAERLVPMQGALLTGIVVAIGNNVVNNLPLGLLAGATLHATQSHGLIADAILIGVDLGPNLSITGSLATILWLLAIRREKMQVSFWSFLKVGVIVMPVALMASLGGAIVIHWLCHKA
jgi:arsenical pump membrane protein